MDTPVKWVCGSPIEMPERGHYLDLPDDFDPSTQASIQDGFFVFTMMPSLRCSLNCPHCYLTLEQRRHSPIMTIDQLRVACEKVADYYDGRLDLKRKVIVCYWYGGEPTEMGMDYMLDAFRMIDEVFPEAKGYFVRHDILTSLLNVDSSWFRVFHSWGRGHFQTSFDGLMRGKGYMKKWDRKVREAVADGLAVSTISVVNHELVADGPKQVLDYLCELGIKEASFLPFMLNEQNRGEKYERFAPPMDAYSDFMIEMTSYWYEKRAAGMDVPAIGQHSFIVSRLGTPPIANIAAQTLFLLPDGDFVLPDYKDGYLEYMKPFGNIFEQSFEDILHGKPRRDYIRRQFTRNHNPECTSCDQMHNCIMEFWKPNRQGDDCFGAKRYVEWIVAREEHDPILLGHRPMMF